MPHDPVIASLGALCGRAALLSASGAEDAAGDLSQRAVRELQNLSDADVRVAFAMFHGFFAAAVSVGRNAVFVPLLDNLVAASCDGRPDTLRASVNAVLSTITAD